VSNKKASVFQPLSTKNDHPKKIGIIGLGRVGMPVANAYLKAGYKVYGYARRLEVIEKFMEMGGNYLASPMEVASQSNIIIIMVLNDQQVIDVITGDTGLLNGIIPGSVIICMSTINRRSLETVASRCNEKNIGFVDCPFTGGPARVPTASLTLIAAGRKELVGSLTPVLNLIGNVNYVGNQPGLGQAVKHCNQLLVGSTHAATMEVITLARKLDLDPSLVCKIVGSGIAGSDYFRLLSDSVLNKKPSPGGLGQMCKDISIVSNTVDEVRMPAYIAKATAKYFRLAEEWGMQDREGADLIEVIEKVTEQNKNPET
jgi:3-hydroxyisobutyrate dehydrogenase-like beta-hydroxyacid dehydrogenase